MENLPVTIQGYSEKGFGKGRASAKSFEVVGTISGEEVLLKPVRKKRRPLYEIETLINASKARVLPLCLHAGKCGGCAWQHIAYEAQIAEKEARLKELFPAFPIQPTLRPEHPWHYRNKMEFSFYQNQHGERNLGLIRAGSRGSVVDIASCMISTAHATTILAAVKKWWEKSGLEAYHASQDRFALRNFTLREGKNTNELMGILTVSGNPEYAPKKSQLAEFKTLLTEAAKPLPISIYLRIQQMIKGMPTQFYEWHLAGPETLKECLEIELPNGEKKSLVFQISPSTFFQPNTHMAGKLYSKALKMAKAVKEDTVIDLYCGVGSIGMCFSFLCKHVLGVELNPYAVLDGKECLRTNGITNMEIMQSDVGDMLKNAVFRPNIITIDPPRAGMGEKQIALLAQFEAKKILYISCNPKTQAEDIKMLSKFGYVLKELQPVDQFPHTPHLETIALIE